MQLKYDAAVDALYVYFAHEPVAKTVVLREDEAHIDFDASGHVIGVELFDASEGVNLDGLPRGVEIGQLLEQVGHFPIYA
jgi:uncharacterized protein YuzE